MEREHRQGRAFCKTNDVNVRESPPSEDASLHTRRQFLGGTIAISGLAWAGLPDLAAAQPTEPPDPLKIGEIRSTGGKLQGVLTIRNERRIMPADGEAPAEEMSLRYFEGKDSSGNRVWPPEKSTGPLPGPTFRARVGDQVEITFLNHVNVADFGKTGIDRAETGQDGGCDQVVHGTTGQVLYPTLAGDSAPSSCFHGSSTSNIHFHGTHVTPDGLGDNVLLQLRPNPQVTEESVKEDFKRIFDSGPPNKWAELTETWRKRQEYLLKEHDRTAIWQGEQGKLPEQFHLWKAAEKAIERGLWPQYQIGAYPYCFKLTRFGDSERSGTPYKMGQCPGTHWYHAHKHGSTAINVLHGMAGVFVIEGDYDDALVKLYPNLKRTEKVLIVQNFSETPNLARGNLGDLSPSSGFNHPKLLWVNGHLRPTIVMQPGEIQLWRLVNATVRAVTTILGFESRDGAVPEIRQIAQDGVQFNFDNYKNQPLLTPRSAIQQPFMPPANTFAPGNRMDLLVKAPLQRGSYAFRVNDTTHPRGGEISEIIVLNVQGEPISSAMDFPSNRETDRDKYMAFPPFLKDINPDEIRIWRKLEFGWDPPRRRPAQQGIVPPAPKFMINGKQFSGDRYDQTMVLNDYEEWTLTNSTTEIAHPFHIHVNPFQVIEIYDPNASDKLYKPDKNFVWQDVIAIPPSIVDANGKVVDQGYVKIRLPFVDFPGSFVLHCHMLAHEDRGMMQLVRVIGSGGEDTLVPHH